MHGLYLYALLSYNSNSDIFGLKGNAVNSFDLNGTSYPLIWGGDAFNITIGSSPDDTKSCMSDALNVNMLAGAIVLCESIFDGSNILYANGTGIIMVDQTQDYALSYPLPATVITPEDVRKVMEYIRTTEYENLAFALLLPDSNQYC